MLSDLWHAAWRWPLHSVRRLIGTVLLVVVLLVALGRGLAATHPPAVRHTAAGHQPAARVNVVPLPSPTDAGSDAGLLGTDVSPSPSSSASGTPSAMPTADPAALTAATGFVQAWATHPDGISPDAWWAAVAPYAEPGFASQLKTTDPTNVPARAVTGAAWFALTGTTSAQIVVPTDAGDMTVTVILVDGRWLASNISPRASGQG